MLEYILEHPKYFSPPEILSEILLLFLEILCEILLDLTVAGNTLRFIRTSVQENLLVFFEEQPRAQVDTQLHRTLDVSGS